jgi:hypothetical protein
MLAVKKRRRQARTAHASKKCKEHLKNTWTNQLEVFSDFYQEIKNPNGHSRTYEENKLLIFAFRTYLHQKDESMNEGDLHPSSITWRSIEEAVACDFCVRCEHLTELGCIFLKEGDIIVFGEGNVRGNATKNYDHSKQQKVSSEHLKEMVKYIDQQHSKGCSVMNIKVLNWFRQEEQGVIMSCHTVQLKLQDLGLSWSKIKPQKRTLGSFRLKAIRDYLISFNKLVCDIQSGNLDGLVFAFADESYVHNTHALDNSYLQKGKEHIGRTPSKGKHLIILHAITRDGPLCEKDNSGKPVDNDLK